MQNEEVALKLVDALLPTSRLRVESGSMVDRRVYFLEGADFESACTSAMRCLMGSEGGSPSVLCRYLRTAVEMLRSAGALPLDSVELSGLDTIRESVDAIFCPVAEGRTSEMLPGATLGGTMDVLPDEAANLSAMLLARTMHVLLGSEDTPRFVVGDASAPSPTERVDISTHVDTVDKAAGEGSLASETIDALKQWTLPEGSDADARASHLEAEETIKDLVLSPISESERNRVLVFASLHGGITPLLNSKKQLADIKSEFNRDEFESVLVDAVSHCVEAESVRTHQIVAAAGPESFVSVSVTLDGADPRFAVHYTTLLDGSEEKENLQANAPLYDAILSAAYKTHTAPHADESDVEALASILRDAAKPICERTVGVFALVRKEVSSASLGDESAGGPGADEEYPHLEQVQIDRLVPRLLVLVVSVCICIAASKAGRPS